MDLGSRQDRDRLNFVLTTESGGSIGKIGESAVAFCGTPEASVTMRRSARSTTSVALVALNDAALGRTSIHDAVLDAGVEFAKLGCVRRIPFPSL